MRLATLDGDRLAASPRSWRWQASSSCSRAGPCCPGRTPRARFRPTTAPTRRRSCAPASCSTAPFRDAGAGAPGTRARRGTHRPSRAGRGRRRPAARRASRRTRPGWRSRSWSRRSIGWRPSRRRRRRAPEVVPRTITLAERAACHPGRAREHGARRPATAGRQSGTGSWWTVSVPALPGVCMVKRARGSRSTGRRAPCSASAARMDTRPLRQREIVRRPPPVPAPAPA